MPKADRRLPCETCSFTIGSSETSIGHRITVNIAYESLSGPVTEIAFVERGKSGHGLDQLLAELGIKLSRALQGRDPDTGEEL